MPRLGSISAKAGARLNAKLAVLRGTRPQKSKMAAFNRREKDEGDTKRAEIPVNEINHPTNQAGGRPTKGGGVGKPESQVKSNQINDKSMTGKRWPAGGDVSSKNPATGNTRMKGRIPAQGGQYGGGGRSTQ